MQAHLGADPVEGLHQEMGGTHPRLDRPKRMLNSLATGAHHLGGVIQAGLHGIEDVLMFPTGDRPLWTGSALILDRSTLTVRTPVPDNTNPASRPGTR
jgi:hypothetical protein